jgi:hypothetical protein
MSDSFLYIEKLGPLGQVKNNWLCLNNRWKSLK